MVAIRHLNIRVNDGLHIAVEDAQPLLSAEQKAMGHAGQPAPLICLAGLTRTMRDFYDLRDHFLYASDRPRRVVLMDARGRGNSDYAASASDYSPLKEADDVANVCLALGLHKPVIVGTSRGGIIAMVLAVAKPGLTCGTVLNDIGPKIAIRGLLRLRAQLGSSSTPANWEEAEAGIRQAIGHQFPTYTDADWAAYARNTYRGDDGALRSVFDPKILAGLSAISSKMPDLDLSAPFRSLVRKPTLLIHGEHSDLLDADICQTARTMGAVVHDVEGQGHAPGLRGSLLETIDAFLATNNL